MNYAKTMMLLASLTALFMGVGWLLGGTGGMAIAFAIAIAMNGWAFWNSGESVLRRHNAQPVTRQSVPELYEMVEDLARNANLPMPKVYLIQESQPNAFATGRSPDHAAVAATTGLLQRLNSQEVRGVMAHELAHIKNRDTLIMTVAATVGGAISMLTQFAFLFRGNGRNSGPLGLIGMLVAIFLAPMAAMMIQMLISRTREYSADKMGAEIARDPMGLANALRKIAGGSTRHEMESAERDPASAHMFIVNPLTGRGVDNLFSTHPNVENRIEALMKLANDPNFAVEAQPAARTMTSPAPTTRRSSIPRTGARR
ncbi:zinc metalloprotease HtpX [Pontivivens insulae]|uniref:Protease HtpX homolog n=1 Tax=Pontivivens insulae TaxID=1639689 RepID=A0A2R8A895_9RHOB|nr:zinc metalloprotease HtpX [Pontivivens insulae]RED18467.1 heat shock protein [Pontivivens insulae]SPF28365.1 Protease HtpX [Pontivivens insulae]